MESRIVRICRAGDQLSVLLGFCQLLSFQILAIVGIWAHSSEHQGRCGPTCPRSDGISS